MSQRHNDTAVSHPAGRHYQVRGHRLWVETEGDGEPLVLLAGLGPAGSHVVFHPFFTGLAGPYQVIYVDLHHPGNAELLATEPGARNTELYPLFVGADVKRSPIVLAIMSTRTAQDAQPSNALIAAATGIVRPALRQAAT
jgi:hypothetical protein